MTSIHDPADRDAAAGRLKAASRARIFDPERGSTLQIGRLLLAVAVIGLWEVGSGRWFDSFYFSKPSLIAKQFLTELADPGFYRDLGVTGLEMVLGYGSGALAGIALGVLLARWLFISRLFDPFLLAVNSIPRIAVAPMLIVWFGIDMASKVFLAATLVFFITFFNTIAGVRAVDQAYCNVARVQGANDWQIFTKVMMPSASSWIITGLKMSLPFALVGVILGEFMVSSKGLGYRLNAYSTSYNTTGALTMIIFMMLIMMVLTALMDRVEARVLRWRPPNIDVGASIKA